MQKKKINLLNNRFSVSYKDFLYFMLLILLLFLLFFSCSHRLANLPDNQNTTVPNIEENKETKEEEPYKVLWQFTAKEEFTSTPVISEGKVIFVGISRNPKMDNFVYAVDQKTGSLAWEHKLDTRPSDYIAESQGLVFVGCNEKLVALDAKTGNTKWEFSDDPEGYPYFTYPVIYNGTLIICKNNPTYVENKDCIFVLDALTGAMKWKKRIDGLLQSNSPVIANGLLYYGIHAKQWIGQIVAVDVLTGQERWHYQASTIWLDQPVANEQIVCFQPEGNELIALDALTGQEKWQFAPDKGHGFNKYNPSI
ncbi:PQQ-binding-like beta-propeller repeat protein, partial [bacterium]|nr:PQQ-binding-like beta-propeller repeat protein [bacterium]